MTQKFVEAQKSRKKATLFVLLCAKMSSAQPKAELSGEAKNGSMHQSSSTSTLKALDEAKFSWFHVLTICVSGMGFFSSAYDLFVISLLTKLIGRVYYPDAAYFSPLHCS